MKKPMMIIHAENGECEIDCNNGTPEQYGMILTEALTHLAKSNQMMSVAIWATCKTVLEEIDENN